MPNLATSSVLDWLRAQEPSDSGLLSGPVMAVEGAADVEAAFVRLGETLDTSLARDPAGLAAALRVDPARKELQAVLGQVGAAWMLRLLDWIMQAGLPESDAVLGAVLTSDSSGTGQFLQAALATSVRPSLLERVYAPDRLAALLAACRLNSDVREAA